MSNYKYKLSIIFGLVVCLLFSILVASEASYTDEFENIFYEASAGMTQLGEDATKLSEGEMSKEAGVRNAKDYKDQAFSQLRRMVQLTTEAPDIDFHTESLSVIANWYLTTELWEQGLQDWDVDKINAATQVMNMIATKSDQMRREMERRFD